MVNETSVNLSIDDDDTNAVKRFTDAFHKLINKVPLNENAYGVNYVIPAGSMIIDPFKPIMFTILYDQPCILIDIDIPEKEHEI